MPATNYKLNVKSNYKLDSTTKVGPAPREKGSKNVLLHNRHPCNLYVP